MINKILGTGDKRRLIVNFFSLSALETFTYFFSLITMPYLFRVLGAEKFGVISFAMSIIMFAKMLVNYGFNLSATLEVSANRADKHKLSEIYSDVTSAKFYLLVVSFLLLNFGILIFDQLRNEWLLFYITFVFVIGEALLPTWFFLGVEQMKYIAMLNIASKMVFTAGVFVFIKSPDDYLYQPILFSTGYLIIGLYAVYFVRVKFQLHFELRPLGNIKSYLIEKRDAFLIEFVPNLYNNYSIMLVGFFTSMEAVGYFSLAYKIIEVFNHMVYTIRKVAFPFLVVNKDKFERIATFAVRSGFAMSLAIIICSAFFLELIFGSNSMPALTLIYIMAFSPFFLSVSTTYGVNKLVVIKKERIYRKIIMYSAILGFIIASCFIPLYGILAGAYTIIFTRGILAVATYKAQKGYEIGM